MAAKPIVDGIEREHGASLQVLRMNVRDDSTKPLQSKYDFRYTPTFILFDGMGNELYRSVGAVDPLAIKNELSAQ